MLQNASYLCMLLPSHTNRCRTTHRQSRRADRFRPEKIPSNLDTIVIGSGSGGSTVANLLAQSGQRVLVLEQHSVTGGCTHSFRESGCEYDTGLVSFASTAALHVKCDMGYLLQTIY